MIYSWYKYSLFLIIIFNCYSGIIIQITPNLPKSPFGFSIGYAFKKISLFNDTHFSRFYNESHEKNIEKENKIIQDQWQEIDNGMNDSVFISTNLGFGYRIISQIMPFVSIGITNEKIKKISYPDDITKFYLNNPNFNFGAGINFFIKKYLLLGLNYNFKPNGIIIRAGVNLFNY